MTDSISLMIDRFHSAQSTNGAVDFVTGLVRYVGIGFHPDTPFAEYVELEDGSPVFTRDEASALDEALARAHKMLEQAGTDIYDVAFDAQRELLTTLE